MVKEPISYLYSLFNDNIDPRSISEEIILYMKNSTLTIFVIVLIIINIGSKANIEQQQINDVEVVANMIYANDSY